MEIIEVSSENVWPHSGEILAKMGRFYKTWTTFIFETSSLIGSITGYLVGEIFSSICVTKWAESRMDGWLLPENQKNNVVSPRQKVQLIFMFYLLKAL